MLGFALLLWPIVTLLGIATYNWVTSYGWSGPITLFLMIGSMVLGAWLVNND